MKDSKILDDEALIHKYGKTIILEGLALADCAKGIMKCVENAENLVQYSKVFIKKDDKIKATIFLVAALEEVGKTNFLLTQSIFPFKQLDIQKATKEFWKKFRSHSKKQTAAIFLQENRSNRKILFSKFLKKRVEVKMFVSLIESARKSSLYVDFGQEGFVSPKEAFSKNDFLTIHFDKFAKKTFLLVKEAREMFENEKKCTARLAGLRWVISLDNPEYIVNKTNKI